MYNYSFIIPHKNCPGLLKRCVDSIPVRDDVQIIVVDDNSDELKKPALPVRKGLEVVLLNASQSKGAGRARNVGMGKAEGKWLLFPDSDDYYVNGILDTLDGYKDSSVDVVYFNFEYRDGKTEEVLEPWPFRKDFDNYDGSQFAKESIRFHHNVPWTKMVRKQFADRNSLSFEEVPNGNDMFFSMMCGYYANNIEVERMPLYVYLRNGSSITTKVITSNDALYILEHLIKQNSFYNFIKHPEWKNATLKMTLYYIKQCGPGLVLLLFRKMPLLINHRNDWVKIVNKD